MFNWITKTMASSVLFWVLTIILPVMLAVSGFVVGLIFMVLTIPLVFPILYIFLGLPILWGLFALHCRFMDHLYDLGKLQINAQHS